MKTYGVCAVIIDDPYILGVSRKDDLNDWNLVGGKVEDGETAEDALIREVKEETGLDVISWSKIFTRKENGKKIVTYYVKNWKGNIGSEESGAIKWCTPSELKKGTYAEYNKKLLQRFIIQDNELFVNCDFVTKYKKSK